MCFPFSFNLLMKTTAHRHIYYVNMHTRNQIIMSKHLVARNTLVRLLKNPCVHTLPNNWAPWLPKIPRTVSAAAGGDRSQALPLWVLADSSRCVFCVLILSSVNSNINLLSIYQWAFFFFYPTKRCTFCFIPPVSLSTPFFLPAHTWKRQFRDPRNCLCPKNQLSPAQI